MLNEAQFTDLEDRLAAAALPRRFAALIGDTPVFDEQGRVMVIENGEIIASIPSEQIGFESPPGSA